ncbi:MAG TPA: hypothetical protein VFI31_22345 [Pirellulales bacterium]|nr:hypothetical protein [Pirellulales bacterium]
MNVEKDDLDLRLDERLQSELSSQLDGQLGRAAPYFLSRCSKRSRRREWHLAAGLAAVAACGIALVTWQSMPPAVPQRQKDTVVAVQPPVVKTDDVPSDTPTEVENLPGSALEDGAGPATPPATSDVASQPLVLGRALSTRTRDEGILLVGRTPVRKVRRQWLERVEWFDPQNGARVQRIVPHEEVLFVPLPIN